MNHGAFSGFDQQCVGLWNGMGNAQKFNIELARLERACPVRHDFDGHLIFKAMFACSLSFNNFSDANCVQ